VNTSERIATMVHAFSDSERRDEVRRIAKDVERLEAVATAARRLEDILDRGGDVGDVQRALVGIRVALAALDEKGGGE
jgi:hypothetical protein